MTSRRSLRALFVLLSVGCGAAAAAACSSDDTVDPVAHGSDAAADSTTSNTDSGGLGDAGTTGKDGAIGVDSSSPNDAGNDAHPVTDAASDVDAGPMFTLTIDNYIAWCSVKQNDGGASIANPIVTNYPAGTVVNLVGAPVSGTFVWGYWKGTEADAAAHNPSTTAVVTMNGNKAIQACCPFASDPDAGCP